MSPKAKKILKLVVLGEAAVGKTSIVRMYCEGTFLEGYKTTIGIDLYAKYLTCSDCSPLIDLTRKRNFIRLAEWLQKLRKVVKEPIPLILIGNKSDILDSRFVNADEAKAYSENNGIYYFETYAKENCNIENIFNQLLSVMRIKRVINLKYCYHLQFLLLVLRL